MHAAKATVPRARIDFEPGKVEQGLLKLVLAIVELIRQLMEKQAMRRIDAGSLSSDDVERVGAGLLELETKIREIQQHFGIDDLDIDLGPIGHLLDRTH
jgi:hypothetical protein